SRRKAIVNADIVAFRPSTLLEPLPECREASPYFRIVLGQARQHADAPQPARLLRVRRKRPRRRTPEKRDELASSHSITSSARASKVGGISKASAFAVLRLITRSNLVGACTGKSAGFSPRRMRST